jgi:hypothetical protein
MKSRETPLFGNFTVPDEVTKQPQSECAPPTLNACQRIYKLLGNPAVHASAYDFSTKGNNLHMRLKRSPLGVTAVDITESAQGKYVLTTFTNGDGEETKLGNERNVAATALAAAFKKLTGLTTQPRPTCGEGDL